ncbi:PREDICTED: uncharacterized protein LOC108762997 [Trachymyrmex cornetzi]|uniref:uncharacterized protein LOC108762997 n=1 Tax=Trachymyrmex cornetzi TaxID=471704 RepID=UPI00084F1068|nr:PREDICTED: uncharacterized protein LOC108762997 [Trachymyrmex cornetzi]
MARKKRSVHFPIVGSVFPNLRTVTQLKKLWTNLKQSQREALTREKQSYLATGGGPPQVQVYIDPDISNIAPHLMKTAPVSFTSNMCDTEINVNRDLMFKVIATCDNQSIELDSDNEDCINTHNIETVQDLFSSTKKDDTLTTLYSGEKQQTNMQKEQLSDVLDNEKLKQTRSLKRKTQQKLNCQTQKKHYVWNA